MKKIITIIGARPQIIKSSAINRAIAGKFKDRLEEIIVHTGQHYDTNMSDVFFNEMGIPKPKYNLEVGSGSHGEQTAKMLAGLEQIYLQEKPVAVLVYGDTNSTIAGALAAIKIHIPVVHVEAGLRSFNKSMPEEVNRIACDHMSTWLFTPTETGLKNLGNEGFSLSSKKISASPDNPKVFLCGDVMFDNSMYFAKVSGERSTILSDLELESNGFVLVTIHRDSNTDVPERLSAIFEALVETQIKTGLKIVLPLHPRTKKLMSQVLGTELLNRVENNTSISIIEPVGFIDIIALEKNARMIITDSGGLQKEAYFFQKPCVILRPQTEWIEIVENGNAVLADADKERILKGVDDLLSKSDFTYPPFYGDGHAAEFIVEQILKDLV